LASLAEILTEAIHVAGGQAGTDQIYLYVMRNSSRLSRSPKNARKAITNGLWDLCQSGFVERVGPGRWKLVQRYHSVKGLNGPNRRTEMTSQGGVVGQKPKAESSSLVFRKILSEGEKRENWVKVPAIAYSYFPPMSVVKVKIDGKPVPMKVNDRGYMWPELMLWDQFIRLLGFDEERDELLFERTAEGEIALSRREIRDWPGQ